MAHVRILYKILPKDIEEGINEEIISSIKRKSEEIGFKFLDYKEEPIAFGLNAVLVLIEVEEREGVLKEVEDALATIPLVSTIEVVRLTRV